MKTDAIKRCLTFTGCQAPGAIADELEKAASAELAALVEAAKIKASHYDQWAYQTRCAEERAERAESALASVTAESEKKGAALTAINHHCVKAYPDGIRQPLDVLVGRLVAERDSATEAARERDHGKRNHCARLYGVMRIQAMD